MYGPYSELRTEPPPENQEGIVYADINLADIGGAKNAIDPVGHYARPDVTALAFDPRPRGAAIRHEAPARRADRGRHSGAEDATDDGDGA